MTKRIITETEQEQLQFSFSKTPKIETKGEINYPTKLDITEIEFHELLSKGYNNIRFGIRIKTTPQNYEKDFADLVIEVKKKLQLFSDGTFFINTSKEQGNK